ncbi:MAG: glycosyltransferase family 2 protein [Alphaproteobacteria bacterium]|nr:glycosyltransferase family 2 protein [Alphaproteobacteria bacterium]
MIIPFVVLLTVGILLALPVIVLVTQITAACCSVRRKLVVSVPRPSMAVVIPAHDEERTIGNTVLSIAPQMASEDRLVVVADNCSDDTAVVARRVGAEVTERFDDACRGKGYALAHGLRHLEDSTCPDVVVFVDADCRAMPGCIDCLARAAMQLNCPVQAAYVMEPPRSGKTAALVSFAWKVKDFVRPLGWHHLNLPCQLAGSGMAFPRSVINLVDLASDHLAEDIKLGIDLAMLGKFPRFCPDAVVTSKVFTGAGPSKSQRTRWEHGALHLLTTYPPRLVVRWLQLPSLSLAAVTLDITVPPLALLALALGIYTTLATLFAATTGLLAPLIAALCLSALFVSAIFLAWLGHGRDLLPLSALLMAPLYALSKLPLYLKFVVARQRRWVRGERELPG